MEANERRVIDVLTDPRRFVVPLYQRQYSWTETELLPFWEDVVAKADEALDREPKFAHFMGALILAPGGDGYAVGATSRVLVVDGQQRLTTFQLLLVALRDVAESLGEEAIALKVKNYLFANVMTGDTGPDAPYRLIPTPHDRKLFHRIVDGGIAAVRDDHAEWFIAGGTGRVIKSRAPSAAFALAYLVDRISAYARLGVREDEGDDSPTEPTDTAARARLEALFTALLYYLKLVVIVLNEDDDAQVIFETLNSKGKPLLAMDLVRNNIFHRATGQGESAEVLFEAKWKPFDASFWKEDAPRAKRLCQNGFATVDDRVPM